MKSNSINKIIAIILVICLTMTDILMLSTQVRAEYEELEKQGVISSSKNVEFDVYFKQNDQIKHSADITIEDSTVLYMKINVKDAGYIRDSKIKFTDSNFEIKEEAKQDDKIKSIDFAEREILLNQIEMGEETEIALPIQFKKQEKINVGYFRNENVANFESTYINKNGKEIAINATKKIQLNWTTQVEAVVEQTVTKFLPYETDAKKGMILVTAVNAGIKDNKLPIENMQTIVKVPTLNGVKPEEVKVYSTGTLATNGDENGVKFDRNNWKYESDKDEIIIDMQNKADQDNCISWKEGKDSYQIVYLYSGVEEIQKMNMMLNAETTIQPYTASPISNTEQKETEIEVNGNVTESLLTGTEAIEKGYMYANSNYETAYQSKWNMVISYADMIDKIEMTEQANQFINANGDRATIGNDTYFEKTVIAKAIFDKLFGEDGEIQIYDQNKNRIATINRNTEVDENGNIVICYPTQDITSIYMETSKPIIEGELVVYHDKKVRTQAYEREMIQSFVELESILQTNIIHKGQSIQNETKTMITKLNETQTVAELYINNTNLSTVVKNENVEIKAILKSSEAKHDLYKNPVIEIVLPKEIEQVDIKSIDLLFSDEIKIQSYYIDTNELGNKVIRIIMEGEQTKFVTDISQGINIIMNTDLVLNKLAASSEKEITMTVRNEKAISYQNDGISISKVNIVAPTGLVTLNSLSNYNEQNETAVSLSSKEQVGTLEIQTTSKIATIQQTIINNEGMDIQNPRILGRLPFSGNKKVTGEELGSNLDMKLVDAIKVQNLDPNSVTIYYSENGEATKDINNAENAWKTENIDYQKVKSYLIVLNQYTMPQASSISLNYSVEIPANLNHNMSSFGSYAVYYDEPNLEGKMIEQMTVAPTIGATTGQGPVIEATIQNNVSEKAATNQYIKYSVTAKNTGNVAAENTKITVTIPDGLSYAEYHSGEGFGDYYTTDENRRTIEIEVGTLATGASTTKEFYLKPSKEGTVEVKASIIASNLEKAMDTNTISTKIEKAYFDISMNCANPSTITESEVLKYTILVGNITTETIKDVKAELKVDDNLTYQEAYIEDSNQEKITDGVKYNDKTKTITWDLKELVGNSGNFDNTEYKVLVFTAKSKTLTEESKQVDEMLVVTGKNVPEHKSNTISNTIVKGKLDVTITSNVTADYIKLGDQVIYTVKVKNTSASTMKDVKVSITIPASLKYLSTKYDINGSVLKEGYIYSDGKSEIKTDLNSQDTLTMVVTTVANKLIDPSKEEEDIRTKVEVESPDTDKIEKEMDHFVENTDKEDENGTTSKAGYRISGIAWLDENRNGAREDNEKRISGIQVKAINAESGKPAKNENGDEIVTTTAEDGKYILSDLAQGKYLVIFYYDNNQYSLTEYQKAGIDEAISSDVIATSQDNTQVAITDNIAIENASKANINMGLVEKAVFNLQLDKTVSKITMQNRKTTKTNVCEDSKLAKIDVDGKEIDSTNLIIEYKIKITNEGTIPGYAKKIADNMPKELKFSSELNKDWYISQGNQVINQSLANTIIQPGESKEVKLVLTKKMTEDGNGVVNNKASIQESYNEYGVEQVKTDNQDKRLSADVIIGLKTGETVMYITLTITIMAIIACGAYLVNKKLLKM